MDTVSSTLESVCHWSEWTQTPLGGQLLGLEKSLLGKSVSKRWDQQILQVSPGCMSPLVQHANQSRYSLICPAFHPSQTNRTIACSLDHLAIKNDSMDIVILHHVLEFSTTPHQLLREANRVLVPGGQLMVLGFNPVSLWGLRRLFSWKRAEPWKGHYYSPWRIKDWLHLLDCELEKSACLHFGLPFQRQSLHYQPRLEKPAAKLGLPLGGCFLLVARKKVAGMMPLRQEFRQSRIIRFPIAEPSTRNLKSSD